MKEVQLTSCITDAEADAKCGWQPQAGDYDTANRESVRILKPDGSLLAIYLRRAIPDELCSVAFPILRLLHASPSNRKTASAGGQVPGRKRKKDGTLSNSSGLTPETMKALGLEAASSAVIGFMDRYTRLPFCRKTAFNMSFPERFLAALPFIQHIDGLFREHVPTRHAAQMEVIGATDPAWRIPGTSFTTVTVNKNYATRYHKDAGDLKAGFGVMSVLRAGRYSGGLFVFPKYRQAFDMGNGDVLLADVHHWHGNTRLRGVPGTYERVSCVFYYRERMLDCGTPEAELARAQSGLRTLK